MVKGLRGRLQSRNDVKKLERLVSHIPEIKFLGFLDESLELAPVSIIKEVLKMGQFPFQKSIIKFQKLKKENG